MSTLDASGTTRQNIIELIIISDAVYNCPVMCRHGVRVASLVISVWQHLEVYNQGLKLTIANPPNAGKNQLWQVTSSNH